MLSRRVTGLVAVAAVTVVASGVLAGCSGDNPAADAQNAVTTFLTAVGKGDFAGAAKQTSDPATAQQTLTELHQDLSPYTLTSSVGTVNAADSSATVNYTLTWKLNASATWSDPASAKLTKNSAGAWQLTWAPTLLSGKLAAGQTLHRGTVAAALPSVIGSDGTALLAPTPVTDVTVYANLAGTNLNSDATTLASALSQFDNTITAQSIVSGATSAGAAGYLVAGLRQTDYQTVKAQIYNLPGVHFPASTELLGPSRNFGGAILPAFRKLAESQASNVSGVTIYTQDAKGNQVDQLYSKDAASVPNIRTTISGKVQQAAEAALATSPQQGMAVVIQPSTGDILAVAGNQQAVSAGLNPLTGLYPPGSTFKVATSNAAFQTNLVTPTTVVPCPATTTIEGRTIPNENNFDLGNVPLTTAFAYSCNTTFSQLATKMTPTELPTYARQLGIGVDYQIPNFTTNNGKITSDTDILARGSDGMGQGKDQVSVFAEALVAATVAHGSTPVPVLIPGETTTSDTKPIPLPAQTQSDLQTMMRAVVTEGTAKSIATINPPVYGKTGTAQFGDGTNSHGWFLGVQNDVAFAFLLVAAGSSAPAVVVAGDFLNNLAQ